MDILVEYILHGSGTMQTCFIEYPVIVRKPLLSATVSGNFCLREVTCLVDTGCTDTSVSRRLANDMGLRPVDYRNMRSVTDSYLSPLYDISLLLKGDGDSKIGIDHFHAPEFSEFDDNVDVILGMDVLNNCNMILDNSSGITKLRIDYFK